MKSNKGFTLIETLVAISIFTVSIVAMVSLTAQGVSQTTYAKNKLTASMLAQEGVEMVRNIRDTEVLSNTTGWDDFKSKVVGSCTVACDINSKTLDIADAGTPLDRDNEGYFVPFSGYTPTIFSRNISVNKTNGSDDEVEIISTVSWTQSGTNRSVSVSEHLFNWFIAP